MKYSELKKIHFYLKGQLRMAKTMQEKTDLHIFIFSIECEMTRIEEEVHHAKSNVSNVKTINWSMLFLVLGIWCLVAYLLIKSPI
jgi:hypothetical protein